MFLPFDNSLAMAEQIIAIDQQTFGDIPYSPEELIARIKSARDYLVYVYYNEGQAAGYIGLMRVQNLHYSAFWIDLLAVSPDFQGKKIAQTMIACAKEVIEKDFEGIEFISALVRQDNLPSLGALHAQGFSADSSVDFKLLFYPYKEAP